MADQDTPTQSQMLGDVVEWQKEVPARGKAEDQEQLVERHPHHQDPTRLDEERTSDNSTVDNGGVGSGAKEDARR